MAIPSNFEPTILRFESLESTNTAARELARKGLAEGTCVVAATQTGGRGRGKHLWHSPPGGLYLSTLLYPRDLRRAPDLALLAGVALSQAVKECLPKSMDVTLKWPNDLLVGWKKVGGILCESLGEEGFNFCIVGIGLNVNIPASELIPFQENPFSATSFMVEFGGGEVSIDQTLKVLLRKLFPLYRLYHEQGFLPIQYLWEKNCKFIGKKIEIRDAGWRDKAHAPEEGGSHTGTFLGIDEAGALVLSNAKGERRQFFSGEIMCFWP